MGKKVKRAGVVPFYKNKNGEVMMMFMMPSDAKYGGKVFQIAKGKVDEGENPLQAAVREANEELGLREGNIKWLRKCGLFLNTHHIYIVEVNSMDDSSFDKPHFETGETIWMTEEEFMDAGRELHKPIIKKCAVLFNSQPSGS